MNKVSLVTIWVEPKTHQIVKYTFDNVNFDFLPAAWLRARERSQGVDDDEPAVQGGQRLWLPRDVDWYFSAMLAIGAFDVRYHLEYHDYRASHDERTHQGRRRTMMSCASVIACWRGVSAGPSVAGA